MNKKIVISVIILSLLAFSNKRQIPEERYSGIGQDRSSTVLNETDRVLELYKLELERKDEKNKLYFILLIATSLGFIIFGNLYRKKQVALKKLCEENRELAEKHHRKLLNEGNNCISEKQRKLYTQFIELIEKEEIYRKKDLSLGKLSKLLKTNRSELSAVLNKMCEINYTSFINGYRINHAIILLSDPLVWEKYTVEGIAKESGFNSKSSFYRLFNKQIGLTPIEFVNTKSKTGKMSTN
ncbi:MAG: AraC family transcriptional regulator [Bacteroidales bacterium]|nr:AraC family transcriptional regulator [Bacteroidales bacterium]